MGDVLVIMESATLPPPREPLTERERGFLQRLLADATRIETSRDPYRTMLQLGYPGGKGLEREYPVTVALNTVDTLRRVACLVDHPAPQGTA